MKTILVDVGNVFVTEEEIFMEMHILLEKFPNKKILLTNADEEKQKELGFINMPYEMFTQNFNPMKSEPEFYENFLKEYNLKIEDVVYFEHNEEAVKSARSLGINVYHYNKDTKDLFALEKFLIENL